MIRKYELPHWAVFYGVALLAFVTLVGMAIGPWVNAARF